MSHYSNIEDLLAEDSFVRWITGSASAKEQAQWEQWVSGDPADRRVMVREAEKWHRALYYDQVETPPVGAERSELMETIHRYEATENTAARLSPKKRKAPHFWMRVAAILLLATMVGWGIYIGAPDPKPDKASEMQWVVSKTEYGEKRNLQLSDGSKIMLNAHSQLKYPKRHSSGDDLQVWLEGEAYFNIVHKTGADRRQFTVHTRDGDVQVLGTKFNVNTRDNQTEIVLEKGQVEVQKTDSGRSAASSYIMEPGELARVTSDPIDIEVQKINPALYTLWTKDRLLFDGTPLKVIAGRIETMYGKEVRITSADLEQTLVSGTISNDNLSVLLASLSRLLDVNINRQERLIIIKK